MGNGFTRNPDVPELKLLKRDLIKAIKNSFIKNDRRKYIISKIKAAENKRALRGNLSKTEYWETVKHLFSEDD